MISTNSACKDTTKISYRVVKNGHIFVYSKLGIHLKNTQVVTIAQQYTNLAFAIATDYGEAGRWAFHAICKLSQKYNETNANKMYSGAIASNHGVKHIASAFYLAKQAGVNIDEVRLKRAEERRKQREKLANLQTCTGGTFPRGGACVHYYNRENT
ncbi:MAG: hypothetical protein SO131_00905, partial [Prevotella sp.]|nr:hypothetical protein [Prevotella sp.]